MKRVLINFLTFQTFHLDGSDKLRIGRALLLILLLIPSFILVIRETGRASTEYVGSETCKGCHEGIYASYMKSIHGKKAISNSPVNREGCESCHGPGAQHVEKGGGKGVGLLVFGRKTDARSKDAKCLGCHDVSKDMPFWDLSKHKTMDVSCVDCHSIHSAKVKKGMLIAEEPALCFTCHKRIRAQTNKQSRHPVKEGKVKCSDCHNSMGTSNTKGMIKADSVNELCYKCHAEKRGPFAFEHPPVQENCLSCHEIHGSNHSRLLVRKVPLLCQSCHTVEGHRSRPYTNLHSFGGSATARKNMFFARSCLNCHGNIHGSSRSPEFTR
jgi:DmsE family decaheme c-type cytochrome